MRAAFAIVCVLSVCCVDASGEIFRIVRGGTYSGGEYESISIDTAEPVVIDGARLHGSGHLIISHYKRAKVTIRNVHGESVRPREAGASVGRFASIEGFDHVTIENCLLEGTAGIYLLDYAGDGSAKQTVRIIANRARDIDGRRSNGNGGFMPEAELMQFVQLDKVRRVSGAEIGWNACVNEPDESRVEDVISIYLSSGTRESPIRIHDNFIRGAYPFPATAKDYSGGGIMLGDGVAGEGAEGDSAFVHAFDNHVLDTVNYGIAISAGHDCRIERNRVLSAGVLGDGHPLPAQNVGIYVWDSYKAGGERFVRNAGGENLVGWAHPGNGRNDWWTPDAAAWEDNQHWPAPLMLHAYDEEYARWRKKCDEAGIRPGPRITPGPKKTRADLPR